MTIGISYTMWFVNLKSFSVTSDIVMSNNGKEGICKAEGDKSRFVDLNTVTCQSRWLYRENIGCLCPPTSTKNYFWSLRHKLERGRRRRVYEDFFLVKVKKVDSSLLTT